MLSVLLVIFFISLIHVLYSSMANKQKYQDKFLSKNKTEFLKGFSIIIVVLAHIFQYGVSQKVIGIPSEFSGVVKTVVLSWGAVGVAVFFFLSGYGNFFSISKINNSKDKLIWFFKKTLKLLLAFFTCYICTIVVLLMWPGNTLQFSTIINDAITLKMTGTSTWYLKVQILMYMFLVLATCCRGGGGYIQKYF